MSLDLGSLGDLVVGVGVDASDLTTGLDQAVAAAAGAASEFDSFFNDLTGPAKLTQEFQNLGTQMNLLGPEVGALGTTVDGQLGLFTEWGNSIEVGAGSLANITNASRAAVPALEDLGNAANDAKKGTDEAGSSIADLGRQLVQFAAALAIVKGLQELGEEALTAAGELEKASISLTALTGSATKANDIIGSLKQLALTDALSFPGLLTAGQRMIALGFDASQLITTLKAAADAAAATGNSLDMVTNAIDRIALSGMAGARQLASLGLSLTDLSKEMGVAAGDVSKVFKLLDESDRLAIITQAMQKYAGVAQQTAQGLLGQWQNLKTQALLVFQDLGDALKPVAEQLMSGASGVLPAIQTIIDAFRTLDPGIQTVIISLGALGVAIIPTVAAIGLFGIAAGGLATALPILGPLAAGFILLGSAVAAVPFTKFMLDTNTAQLALETTVGPANQAAVAFYLLDTAIDTFTGKAAIMEGTMGAMQGNITRLHAAGQGWIDDLANQAMAMGKAQEATMKMNDAMALSQKIAAAYAAAMKSSVDEVQNAIDRLGTATAGLLEKIPATYTQYVLALQNGGQQAKTILGQIQTDINKLTEEMNQTSDPKKIAQLQGWIDELTKAQATVKGFAAGDDLGKLADQVSKLGEEFAAQVGELDPAVQEWVKQLTAYSAALHKAADNTDPAAILKNLLEMQKEFDDMAGSVQKSWATFTDTFAKGLTTEMNDLGVFKTQMQEDVGAINKSWQDSSTTVTSWGGKVAAVYAMLKSLKIDDVSADQQELKALQANLATMIQMGVPLREILSIQGMIDQLQLNIATSTGQTANTVLMWQEQLTLVQAKQAAIKSDTVALSQLYTQMIDAFSKAWTDLGKGIGDAIVSGQNFGAAFTKVFDDLKKQLAEFVTNYLLGMLKNALLENTDLMGTFNKIFNAIFGGDGAVMTGLTSASKATQSFGDAVTEYTGQAGDAVKGFADTATSSMKSAATSVGQSASQMVSGLTAVASVVSAIASIFSAIELMHTNTLLDRIEHETARMAIYLGDSGSNSIQFYTGKTAEIVGYVHSSLQLSNTYLAAIADAMNTVKTSITAMVTSVSQMAAGIMQALTGVTGGSAGDQINTSLTDLTGVVETGFTALMSSVGGDVSDLITVINAWFTKLLGNATTGQTGAGGIFGPTIGQLNVIFEGGDQTAQQFAQLLVQELENLGIKVG